MKMKCVDFLSGLSAYIDGETDSRTARKAREHLLKCASCQKAHAKMQALIASVRTLDVPVPENLADDVLAAVRESAAAEKKAFRPRRVLPSWSMYSALAACLLLFTVFTASHRYPVQNASLPPAVAEEPAADTAPTTYTTTAKNDRMMPGSKAAPAMETALGESEAFQYVTDANQAYEPVSSLSRRRITIVAEDAAAEAVFDAAKKEGLNAVIDALSAAGYTFRTEVTVLEDCTAAYNALCEEANSLSARLAEGDESARDALAKKEAELESLKSPETAFALEK